MSTVADQLLKELKKINRAGSFCSSGSLPAILPGLEVAGLGQVGFPLTPKQAQELKAHCRQAPHGRGAKTLVDTKVRRVWQMDPDQFTLTNPAWYAFLDGVVNAVQKDLGLERQKLAPHLYKLLLYEKGDFFLPHRDGERLARMVATLIVVLPSAFAGGELIVRLEGEEQVIDFGAGAQDLFHVDFAAFYADCEHEVRPLTSGCRLCLVYNLTLAKEKHKAPAAPRIGERVHALTEILRGWAEQKEPRRLAITLEHKYTQAGLSWDALKGVDRVRARVLADAARGAGCHAYVALLTLWESGEGEDGGYEYEYGWGGRRRRYYDDYEDDDFEDEDDADEEDEEDLDEADEEGRAVGQHVMEEVFDSSLTANHWSDAAGGRPQFGEMHIEPEEIVPPEAITAFTPEEDYTGYTGNEGTPLERWYRRAAIVVWPNDRHFAVLCDCGAANALQSLTGMVAKSKKAPAAEAAAMLEQCRTFARGILAAWSSRDKSKDYMRTPASLDLLKAIGPLNDPRLLAFYLTDALASDAALVPGKKLPTLLDKHGWESFQQELASFFEKTTNATLDRNIRILEELTTFKTRKQAARNAVCDLSLARALAALQTSDAEGGTSYHAYPRINRSEVLAGIVRVALTLGRFELLGRLLAHVRAVPKHYSLEVQLAALVSLKPWLKKNLRQPCAPLVEWLDWCRGQLQALTARMPEEPADFRRAADVGCKCADCRELKEFLRDPQAEQHRFPARQDRRDHLEHTVRNHHCDVKCATERRGSPYTLVLTKTTASYEASLKKYHQDLEHLAMVEAIQSSL